MVKLPVAQSRGEGRVRGGGGGGEKCGGEVVEREEEVSSEVE
jgi:hypothetical protein